MSLNLDPAVAYRRPSELQRLVTAVVEATAEDEQDWLEWKSALNLTDKRGQFAIARAILGMANRDPSRASLNVGGLGFVVIGASPGSVAGVEAIDPAALDDALARYLGNAGPAWSVQRVRVWDGDALVITVEPPEAGDPIFVLRKSFQGLKGEGADEGTVFVRVGTKTRRATADDMEMLQRRLLLGSVKSADGPDIRIDVAGELVPIDDCAVRAKLADLAQVTMDEILRDASEQRSQRDRLATGPLRGLRWPDLGLTSPLPWKEYYESVKAWGVEAVDASWEELLYLLTEDGVGAVDLTVSNDSPVNLHGLEVVLTLPSELRITAFDEFGAEAPQFPERPVTDGSQSLPLIARQYDLPHSLIPPPAAASVGRQGVYIECCEDGRTEITYVVGHLRPHQTLRADSAYVFLLASTVQSDVVPVQWRATSTSTDGVRFGIGELVVGDQVSPDALVALTTLCQ